MKILQINEVNGVLSTGRTTFEMAKELERLGHECYIAYSEGMQYEKKSYRIGSFPGKKLHSLLSRITGFQGYFSSWSTYRLLHYLKKLQPDIVHLRNLHGSFLNLNMLLSFLAKEDIATVITLHDCWFFTGRCTHYTYNQCYQWKVGCMRCPNNRNTTPNWFFDRCQEMWKDKKDGFNQIDRLAVVGVSQWITREACTSFLSNATIITHIYNWIDLNVFRPLDGSKLKQLLGVENKFVILGVATFWEEAKGINDFIKLATMISEDYRIILIGSLRKNIELSKNIIHIPRISNTYVLTKFYSMSDVLLSLSKEETFGKTIAEAMACGTPSIVYNNTACQELIGEGCGYVLQNNSLDEINNFLHKIKMNSKQVYKSRCRTYAKKHYDMHKCIKQYLDLYQTLLTGGK